MKQIEYAGSLFDSPRKADLAAVYDWLTSNGTQGLPEIQPGYGIDSIYSELEETILNQGFRLPSIPDKKHNTPIQLYEYLYRLIQDVLAERE